MKGGNKMETNLKNRVEIDITNLKTTELEEVSKEHPNGYIKNKNGKILWGYEKEEIAPINTPLGTKQRDEIRDRLAKGAEEEIGCCDTRSYAEWLVEEA